MEHFLYVDDLVPLVAEALEQVQLDDNADLVHALEHLHEHYQDALERLLVHFLDLEKICGDLHVDQIHVPGYNHGPLHDKHSLEDQRRPGRAYTGQGHPDDEIEQPLDDDHTFDDDEDALLVLDHGHLGLEDQQPPGRVDTGRQHFPPPPVTSGSAKTKVFFQDNLMSKGRSFFFKLK